MIKIESKKNKFTYNVYHVTKAFYPEEEIVQTVDEKQAPFVKIQLPEGTCFSLAPEECVQTEDAQEEKRDVTKKVYQFFSNQTGKELAWGMLTGVRPTKLVMMNLEEGRTKEEIFQFLKEQYCVGEKKAELAYEIACREKALLDRLDCENGYSLYAGIPFCPSICSYCSFSSSPIDKWKDQVDRYLDALIKELKAVAEMTEGKVLDTVYIGGGTPTTLEADQLDRLLRTIQENFDLDHVLEFTIEAGRPDSITREKLEVIRRYPVTRISVNPQTMQQKTLDLVGRRHTVEDVERIFHLARELGFDNINMDLIAGLPGETAEDMQDTLKRIEKLHPDSLTVHALAIKRAAKFGQEGRIMNQGAEITQMVDDAAECAKRMGLVPYYLYRQKNIAGNFENVGYAEEDKAGIYNILIMEEQQSIFACGAGSTTKRVRTTLEGEGGHYIERCENIKDVKQYVERIDEMIERKKELFEKE